MKFRNLLLTGLLMLAAFAPAAQAQLNKPIYVSLLPHFVVNLGPGSYMQLKAQVLVNDAETEQAMKLHMDAIRHDLLMLFSDLRKQDVNSAEGKERLGNDALGVIRKTLTQHAAANKVAGFFITSLVIQ